MRKILLAVAVIGFFGSAYCADNPNDNYLFNRMLEKLTAGVPTSGSPGAANQATARVALTTTAAQVVAARATRRNVLIVNTDTAITVYVGNTGVTSATGVPILPGQGITIPSVAAQFAVAASGTPTVAYFETYD